MRLRRTIPALAIAAVVAQPAVATADLGSTTTINGQVPPGVAAVAVEPVVFVAMVAPPGVLAEVRLDEGDLVWLRSVDIIAIPVAA